MHLAWTWDNHIFSWLFLSLVRVVMMVVVMNMTKIGIYETVCLDLCCWLEVEMLIWMMHSFKIATVACCFWTMVMMLSVFLLRILL